MRIGNPSAYAFFLDIDGTLIDIAPTPDEVAIPRDLAQLLERLSRRVGGALAILTGRPIAEVDSLLAPLAPPAAGIHGAELRLASGGAVELHAGAIESSVEESVRDVVCEHPEIIVETKRASIAVHYRQAASLGPYLECALARIVAASPDHLILARGRKVLEIMPRHVSKGMALEAFMQLTAFKGRRPVMIGDDISDLSAFEAAVRLGGRGLKVAGEQFTRAEADFASPAEVRAWFEALVEGLAS